MNKCIICGENTTNETIIGSLTIHLCNDRDCIGIFSFKITGSFRSEKLTQISYNEIQCFLPASLKQPLQSNRLERGLTLSPQALIPEELPVSS
jgi:hypothetical protein